MILGAKARAILRGRFAVTAEDVRALAHPVLRHRMFTNFNADAEGIDADQIIDMLLKTIPEPSYGDVKQPPTLVVVDQGRHANATGMPRTQEPVAPPVSSMLPPTVGGEQAAPQPVAPHQPAPQTVAPQRTGADQFNWPPGAGPDGRSRT